MNILFSQCRWWSVVARRRWTWRRRRRASASSTLVSSTWSLRRSSAASRVTLGPSTRWHSTRTARRTLAAARTATFACTTSIRPTSTSDSTTRGWMRRKKILKKNPTSRPTQMEEEKIHRGQHFYVQNFILCFTECHSVISKTVLPLEHVKDSNCYNTIFLWFLFSGVC